MGPCKIPRALKICCIVTAILVIILVAVVLALYFTILKPKQPKVTTKQVTIEHLRLILIPFHLNVTLGIVVNVDNRPNHGSFKYHSTTSYITYHGSPAAEAPIAEGNIPARGETDISTEVLVVVDNLFNNPSFQADWDAGCLNFTSSTTVKGKVKVLKFLKIKATTHSTCDISVYVQYQNASAACRSKIKY